MRRLIFIPLLFICLSLTAGTYYVATGGNNSNPGTIGQPWLTWQKAFTTAVAGDTVFFRGGVYYTTSLVSGSNNGTLANPICFFNYPGEVPILDGINKTSPGDGVRLTGRSYIHMKGLHVRNNKQITVDNKFTSGIVLYEGCDNITLTNCVSYNNGVRGFFFRGVLTVNVYNCDAYDNADSLTAAPSTGNNGDGFMVHALDNNTNGYVTFRGCRSWHNSDDGFDVNHEGYVEIDSSWTWGNGYLLDGNGCGYKLTLSSGVSLALSRKLTNSISAYNKYNGITTNDRLNTAIAMHVYNNISYHNSNYGVYLYNTSSSDAAELTRDFKNNISYGNTVGAIGVGTGGLYTHDHNSWDIAGLGNFTNTDFLSVDSAGLGGARTAGGYLPVLNFLKPSSTSRAINVGVDVGYGNDIGAYQFAAVDPGSEIIAAVVFTTGVFPSKNSVVINANVYDDGGGTVTQRGVCISMTTNPTTLDELTDNGSGTGAYQSLIGGLLEKTVYHIRAYAINEIGISYSTDVQFTTTGGGIVTIIIDGVEKVVVHSDGRIITVDEDTSPPYYYVSNTGNDANNGLTPETAWQTIAKVNASSFLPGNRVLFKKGDIWREKLTVPSSGNASGRIIFSSYGTGAKPLIQPTTALTSWTQVGSTEVYYAALAADPRSIFINNTYVPPARYPSTVADSTAIFAYPSSNSSDAVSLIDNILGGIISPYKELLLNTGFETFTGNNFTTWFEEAYLGDLIEQTATSHGGSSAVKMTRVGASASTISQTITLIPSKNYTFSFWTRGSGTKAGYYAVYDVTHSAFIIAKTLTGITGTDYTNISVQFQTPSGCTSVRVMFYHTNFPSEPAYYDDASVIPIDNPIGCRLFIYTDDYILRNAAVSGWDNSTLAIETVITNPTTAMRYYLRAVSGTGVSYASKAWMMTENSWFYDTDAARLYVWKTGGENPGTVEASNQDIGINIVHKDYITIDGLAIKYVRMKDWYLGNPGNAAIYISNTEEGHANITIQNVDIDYAGFAGISLSSKGISNLQIANCTIDHSHYGIYATKTSGMISENTITNIGGIYPELPGNGIGIIIDGQNADAGLVTISNTIMTNVSRNGISFVNPRVAVINNIITNTGIYNSDSGGIYTGNTIAGSGSIISGNTVTNCANNIYLDLNSVGFLVTRNTVTGGNIGVVISGSDDIVITRNSLIGPFLYDHEPSASGIYVGKSTGIISYNIINPISRGSGIFAYQSNIGDAVDVYNNIIMNAAIGLDMLDVANSWGNIKNNIFYNNLTSHVSAYSGAFTSINNNLYYGTGNWIYEDVPQTTFALWKTASSQDANSLNSDPSFVGALDFHLQTGSPAINAGVDVGLTTDYAGNPIVGLPDIGAYEKQ